MHKAFALGAVLALTCVGTAEAKTEPTCDHLAGAAVGHAIDYALERSSVDDLASRLDLNIDTELYRCQPTSTRRAVWHYRLVIREHADVLVREAGVVIVTRKRGTFRAGV